MSDPQRHSNDPNGGNADHNTENDQSLVVLVQKFWDTEWRSKYSKSTRATSDSRVGYFDDVRKAVQTLRKDASKELMEALSKRVPATKFKTQEDHVHCLRAIKAYIDLKNKDVLEFLELVEAGAFEQLYIRLRSFSAITSKDIVVLPETLVIHDPHGVESLFSWLISNPEVFQTEQLIFPSPSQYSMFKMLLQRFLIFFHQSSEQAAVMKVAGYNLLLQFANPDLCAKYYPEFQLFNLSSEDSPAEVVAWVEEQRYCYLMSGRADGFIVTLMTAEQSQNSNSGRVALVHPGIQRELSEICTPPEGPKYQNLVSGLGDLLGRHEAMPLSYEIVLLEVKKSKSKNGKLTGGLEQVITECAAIKEYGPDSCRILKFILSDGDQWIFGVLRNPSHDAIGQDSQRNCFYTVLDNAGLTRIEDVIKLLAVWMVVSGDVLLSFFEPEHGDASDAQEKKCKISP